LSYNQFLAADSNTKKMLQKVLRYLVIWQSY